MSTRWLGVAVVIGGACLNAGITAAFGSSSFWERHGPLKFLLVRRVWKKVGEEEQSSSAEPLQPAAIR